MVWGNLSSLLFPDYTLYIYDIHLLLVVGCLLLSTSRTSMAIAAFSFYDMIWRFLKPIEPLLPANKWPLFCNINTLGRSLVFFGPKVKGKSRWTFWIQQDFKESIVVLILVEEVEVEANKFYQKKICIKLKIEEYFFFLKKNTSTQKMNSFTSSFEVWPLNMSKNYSIEEIVSKFKYVLSLRI